MLNWQGKLLVSQLEVAVVSAVLSECFSGALLVYQHSMQRLTKSSSSRSRSSLQSLWGSLREMLARGGSPLPPLLSWPCFLVPVKFGRWPLPTKLAASFQVISSMKTTPCSFYEKRNRYKVESRRCRFRKMK